MVLDLKNKVSDMLGRIATPGPGTYEQNVQGKSAPKAVLVPRRPDSAPARGRGTPGPGQYEDILSHKRAAPKYGMGTGEARVRAGKDTKVFPAPNNYSPSRNNTLMKSPTWVIGTSQRRPLSGRNANPGPGTYVHTVSTSGPAYGLRGRNHVSFNEKTPGPGQYTPHPETVREKAPTYRIGTEEKIQKDRSTKRIVPGPGQYENPKTNTIRVSPSYGFGTGERDHKSKSSAPGPGHYHIPCKVVDVPRYLNTNQQEEFRYI